MKVVIRRTPDFVNPPGVNLRQQVSSALADWFSFGIDYRRWAGLGVITIPPAWFKDAWPNTDLYLEDSPGPRPSPEILPEGILERLRGIPEGTKVAFYAGLIDEVEVP